MKKLFMTMLALCVLASCGGSKKSEEQSQTETSQNTVADSQDQDETSGGDSDTTTTHSQTTAQNTVADSQEPNGGSSMQSQSTPTNLGEFFLALAQLNNKCTADVEKANSAEDFVCAIEAYVTNLVEFHKNASNYLSNVNPEDNRKYQKEGQEYAASTERMRVALNEKGAQFRYTLAQQQRLEKVFMMMANGAQQNNEPVAEGNTEKTPGEIFVICTELIDNAVEEINNSPNAEAFLSIVEKLTTEVSQYDAVMENLTEADYQKYSNEAIAFVNALKNFQSLIGEVREYLTPEQQQRLDKMLE